MTVGGFPGSDLYGGLFGNDIDWTAEHVEDWYSSQY